MEFQGPVDQRHRAELVRTNADVFIVAKSEVVGWDDQEVKQMTWHIVRAIVHDICRVPHTEEAFI